MKYKVGDKVRVRTDLEVDEVYGGEAFMEGMSCFKGEILTIATIDEYGYTMVENDFWYWTNEMLEAVAITIPIDKLKRWDQLLATDCINSKAMVRNDIQYVLKVVLGECL